MYECIYHTWTLTVSVQEFNLFLSPKKNNSFLGVLLLISQIYYWRDSSQLRWHRVNRGMKSKTFPNDDPEPSGVLTGLIPYSNYKMYIVVANNRYEGPPSNNIHFSTPEGGKKNHPKGKGACVSGLQHK